MLQNIHDKRRFLARAYSKLNLLPNFGNTIFIKVKNISKLVDNDKKGKKMVNFRVVYDDYFIHVFEYIHEGIKVHFIVDKCTCDCFVYSDDEARCLGFASLNDLMKSDSPEKHLYSGNIRKIKVS